MKHDIKSILRLVNSYRVYSQLSTDVPIQTMVVKGNIIQVRVIDAITAFQANILCVRDGIPSALLPLACRVEYTSLLMTLLE